MSPRKKRIRSISAKSIALILYAVFTLIMVLNHEYWFDEGQAWNIARDNSLSGIVGVMKYEGHPPLWHFLLKLFITFGCSYKALGLVSWGISVLTAGLVLFALPAKPYMKIALLVSGHMLYFNSVISRTYCLIGLLVILIAIVHPKRKKHPILLGILTALLTNTHIVMCGLVGGIGIFMLIDLFAEWRRSSKKENFCRIVGLVIAGAGVIALVLPLIGCMTANSVTSNIKISAGGIVANLIESLPNIVRSACASNLPNILGGFLTAAICVLSIAAFVFSWEKRRRFVIALIFSLMFIVTDEIIFYSVPCRGVLFLFTNAVILGTGNPAEVTDAKLGFEATWRIGKWLSEKAKKLGSNVERTVSVSLSVLLALTIPSAAVFAAEDLRGEFVPTKTAARFVSENIPEDALLLSYSDSLSPLLTYLPERKIFSVKNDEYYTYCMHKVINTYDHSNLNKEVREHSEIYYISVGAPYISDTARLVYENENYIPYQEFGLTLFISKISPNDIKAITNLTDP